MNVGKVPETILKRSVFKQLDTKRSEVLIGPGVGEDCAVIEVSDDECIVLSTDPITGTANNIGALAVHITLNDLAAGGAEPIGLMLTLLLPDGYEERDLKALMKEVNILAKTHEVQIIGGHTEITDAVTRPVISVTGVGKIPKNHPMLTASMEAEMAIIMTKWAGIEGTSILAKEGEAQLGGTYHSDLAKEAKAFDRYLSVLPESRIARRFTVVAMHDVTEGGIFGALWELGSKGNLGLIVHQDRIPIRQETVEICEFYDLNPYMLIGSGSLLIVTSKEESLDLVEALEAESIPATIIGYTKEGKHKQIRFEDTLRSLEPPKADELYAGLQKIDR